MKRLRSFLLAFLVLLALPGLPARAQEGYTDIHDAAGLLAIAQAPGGSYRLADDIDLAGIDWSPIPFSGTLEGNGHTIYNLTVTSPGAETRVTRDGNVKEYDTVFAALFSTVEYATVRDLSLVGANVTVDGDTHCFAAILAGYVDHSTLGNCRVEGRVRLNNNAVMAGVGGVAGFGCGVFDRCSADVELIFEDRNLTSRCEEFMGGILACGIADFTSCTVDIDGYDSCHGYVHNGGLIGMYFHCGLDYPYGVVNYNTVRGQITFFEDNPDRRAYCSAIIGERMGALRERVGNTEHGAADFKSNETKDFSTVLLPEKCAQPIYEETVVHSCDSWGYTLHRCATCGCQWKDSYTPPHTPGPWETVREASHDGEGLERQSCTVCGTVLAERVLPALEREPLPTEVPEQSAPPVQPVPEAPKNAPPRLSPVLIAAVLVLLAVILVLAFWKKQSYTKLTKRARRPGKREAHHDQDHSGH